MIFTCTLTSDQSPGYLLYIRDTYPVILGLSQSKDPYEPMFLVKTTCCLLDRLQAKQTPFNFIIYPKNPSFVILIRSCRFVPYTFSETSRHTWFFRGIKKSWWNRLVWRLDSGPNLQPSYWLGNLKKNTFGCFQKLWYPQIINFNFNRVFHYKPSILGYHYFWKHPFSSLCQPLV